MSTPPRERRPRAGAPSTGIATDQGSESTEDCTAAPLPVVASDASRRRDRIRLLLGSITETTEKLADLIEAARDSEDHVVLGFSSWTAYVAAEFSGLLAGLGTADRRVAVHALATSGMPTRAIAEVAGISQSTAARDVRVSHSDSPAETAGAAVVLADGSTVTATAAELRMADASDDEFEAALTAARAQDDLSQRNVVQLLAPRVTGRDGRSYPQQGPPRTPRRRPLPDAYADAASNLLGAELTEDEPVLALPQPARRGPRAKNVDVLSRIANAMQGYDIVLSEITVLDNSVTQEEAVRLRADLLRTRKSLDRVIGLLGNKRTDGGDL